MIRESASSVMRAAAPHPGRDYFFGNVNVTGTVSKLGRIVQDRRSDRPDNKYLYHSFVESSDMMNIYNGVTILDARGERDRPLPAWFESLNSDFRYQLTCMGGFSPVWIEREVQGSQFAIKGEKPGQKVSWQLTGIRQDAWANAHRIPGRSGEAGIGAGIPPPLRWNTGARSSRASNGRRTPQYETLSRSSARPRQDRRRRTRSRGPPAPSGLILRSGAAQLARGF